MEDMLWIEDIVESTPTPPFLTNLKIEMAKFMFSHKVIARRSAFSTLLSAWNGGELEGEVGSGRLKHQNRKTMKEKKKKRNKPNVNLILSHGNHTFLISNPQIGPQAFRHTHCISRKECFFQCEERSNSRFNLLQVGPWAFGPFNLVKNDLKITLNYT
jgi:hypothetical protein